MFDRHQGRARPEQARVAQETAVVPGRKVGAVVAAPALLAEERTAAMAAATSARIAQLGVRPAGEAREMPGRAKLVEVGEQRPEARGLPRQSQARPAARLEVAGGSGAPTRRLPAEARAGDRSGVRAGAVTTTGLRWRSATMASAARAPNTSPSRSELLARRLAPWTPLQATSPPRHTGPAGRSGPGGRSPRHPSRSGPRG